jgi:hypothetical protein
VSRRVLLFVSAAPAVVVAGVLFGLGRPAGWVGVSPRQLIALVGTVLLAVLIMRLPLRGAARFKPGDAIRYA